MLGYWGEENVHDKNVHLYEKKAVGEKLKCIMARMHLSAGITNKHTDRKALNAASYMAK